jgi:hypothetical protein
MKKWVPYTVALLIVAGGVSAVIAIGEKNTPDWGSTQEVPDSNALEDAARFISQPKANSPLAVQVPKIPMSELTPLGDGPFGPVYFKTKDNKVYFSNSGQSSILYPHSDPDTFSIFPESKYVAKDATTVYVWAYPLEGADPATFELLYLENVTTLEKKKQTMPYFARDKENVYSFTNRGLTYEPVRIPGADPSSFKVHATHDNYSNFATDHQNLYINSYNDVLVIDNVDVPKLEYLGGGYFQDGTRVYSSSDGALTHVDPASFMYLGGGYTKDARNVYYDAEPLQGADSASFVLVSSGTAPRDVIAKDASHVYSGGKQVSGIDAESFKLVGKCANVEKSTAYFYKDAAAVYVSTTKVEGVDVATFKLFDTYYSPGEMAGGAYAKDKDSVFYRCNEVLSGVEADSFEPLGNGYIQDDNGIYFHTSSNNVSKIISADPRTFELLYSPEGYSSQYAKDSQYAYCSGRVLEDANPRRLQYLGQGIAVDENTVYMGDLQIGICKAVQGISATECTALSVRDCAKKVWDSLY